MNVLARSSIWRCLLVGGWFVLVIVVASVSLAAGEDKGKNVAAAIEKLTGAATKFVWVRSAVAGKGVVDGEAGDFYQLMVFDTHEAKERVLLPGPGSCANPLITGDGAHVVYSRLGGAGKVCAVDWDGTNRRELVDGFAVALWRDPASGVQWIYVGNNYTQNTNQATAGITRYRLDDPSVKELVWNKTQVEQRAFLSSDGKRFGSGFPWPNQGVADLASGTWKQYGSGCNPSIAPDTSYRFFHMNGSHVDITMYDDGGANARRIATAGDATATGKGMFWNPKWTNNVRFFTICGPFPGGFKYAVGSHPWLGEFNEAFTGVKQWIALDFGLPANFDTYCHGWIETGLGQFGGEAPYVVEVSADRLGGEWEINYGDGTTEKATAIRHTYAKAGRFALAARQGQRELKGTVDVRPQKPPKVTGALLLDDTHVLVTFDEPVQAPSGKVALSPQTAARNFQLSGDGTELVAEFPAPLPKTGAAIKLQGFTDLAQTPNPLTRNKVPVARPKWPGRLTGVACLWQGAKGVNRCYHEAKKAFVKTSIIIAANRLDRNGALVLSGGAEVDAQTVANIGQTVRAAKAISLQLVLQPAEPKLPAASGLLPILVLRGPDELGFVVGQKEDKLVLRAKTVDGGVQEFPLGVPSTLHASQVVISYKPGKLFAQLDYKKAVESDKLKGSPLPDDAAKGYAELLLGTPAAAGQPTWKGKIEALAVHGRALDKGELSRDRLVMAKILSGRKTLPQIEVQTKLAAKSTIPKAADIAPYRHALIVCEYTVAKTLKGMYSGKTIRVAQWGLYDTKETALAAAKVGDSVRLVLEKFEDHPELESQLLQDTLDEDYEAVLYTDVEVTKLKDMKAQKDEENAERAMKSAEQLFATKKYAQALKSYESIVEKYSETEAGESAVAKIANIKTSQVLAKKVYEQKAARECAGLIGMARSYIMNGKHEKGREYLRKIIDKYPDTEHGAKAKKMMDELPQD